MGNETFYQEDLKNAYLKSDTFLVHVPDEWFILIKNPSYMHLKTPAADPWKQIHYRTLPPIVAMVCLSFSQPILWDVPNSFVAVHSPPPPPAPLPVTPYMALTINRSLHHEETPNLTSVETQKLLALLSVVIFAKCSLLQILNPSEGWNNPPRPKRNLPTSLTLELQPHSLRQDRGHWLN